MYDATDSTVPAHAICAALFDVLEDAPRRFLVRSRAVEQHLTTHHGDTVSPTKNAIMK